MQKNKQWESFIGIIVWVFILSIVILGLGNLINYSRVTVQEHQDTETLSLLEKNAYNIVHNLDLSALVEWDTFYVYKNTTTKNFEIFIGPTNTTYKYIDKLWNKVDNITFQGDIYAREFIVEKEDVNPATNNYVIQINIKKYN